MRVRVSSEWAASYEDPIVLAAGERLTLTGERDVWDGFTWLWAVSEQGKEGWLPDDLPQEAGNGFVASEAYSAVELDCPAGAELELLREKHGWAWCRNDRGREGWVPLRILLPED